MSCQMCCVICTCVLHSRIHIMCVCAYCIALYFRGPKLSRLEHTKQFHDFWYGSSLLKSPSAPTTSELAVDMDDDGISLDKRPVGLGN